MKLETLNEVKLLREYLDNDPRIKNLKEKESAMVNSPKAKELSSKMKLASSMYEDDLNRYGFDSPYVVPSRKQLHNIKLELDSLTEVKEYMEAYKEVRELYNKIDEIIFSPYKDKRKCK